MCRGFESLTPYQRKCASDGIELMVASSDMVR